MHETLKVKNVNLKNVSKTKQIFFFHIKFPVKSLVLGYK